MRKVKVFEMKVKRQGAKVKKCTNGNVLSGGIHIYLTHVKYENPISYS